MGANGKARTRGGGTGRADGGRDATAGEVAWPADLEPHAIEGDGVVRCDRAFLIFAEGLMEIDVPEPVGEIGRCPQKRRVVIREEAVAQIRVGVDMTADVKWSVRASVLSMFRGHAAPTLGRDGASNRDG